MIFLLAAVERRAHRQARVFMLFKGFHRQQLERFEHHVEYEINRQQS